MGISRRKKLIRKLGVAGRAKAMLPTKRRAPASVPPPSNSIELLLRAAGFAARKHHGQVRADAATPYFAHVARVTLILSHVFHVEDEEILTAALLHDTIEDTATDYDEIAVVFGDRIADYVVQLTKNVMLPKLLREEDYQARLTIAPEPVMIAKMADLYDNLSDRLNSPKLHRTAASAERLLAIFGDRLETAIGRQAHQKLTALLKEVKSKHLAHVPPPPVKRAAPRKRKRVAGAA
jgi:guanosine-3',5'-bis(diphosphate) 3'-pyrophosphohydrolase